MLLHNGKHLRKRSFSARGLFGMYECVANTGMCLTPLFGEHIHLAMFCGSGYGSKYDAAELVRLTLTIRTQVSTLKFFFFFSKVGISPSREVMQALGATEHN